MWEAQERQPASAAAGRSEGYGGQPSVVSYIHRDWATLPLVFEFLSKMDMEADFWSDAASSGVLVKPSNIHLSPPNPHHRIPVFTRGGAVIPENPESSLFNFPVLVSINRKLIFGRMPSQHTPQNFIP